MNEERRKEESIRNDDSESRLQEDTVKSRPRPNIEVEIKSGTQEEEEALEMKKEDEDDGGRMMLLESETITTLKEKFSGIKPNGRGMFNAQVTINSKPIYNFLSNHPEEVESDTLLLVRACACAIGVFQTRWYHYNH